MTLPAWDHVPSDPRSMLRRVRELLDEDAGLQSRYETAKRVVRRFRKPAFYEITQRCNLKCEGCYYFEGSLSPNTREEDSLEAWDAFFATEARRQVSMAYFVGAEPSLEQERLAVASRYLPHGNVGCNGSIRIDPAIPYRISVSVWGGDDETERKLRGASVFRKAFKNYRGDPRVIFYYTLSRWNLGSVRSIAQMCHDHGVPLTFNLYSPTVTFLAKLRAGTRNDTEFFRLSSADNSPIFSADDILTARRKITELMEEFPETVLYSSAYNEWSTSPSPIHEIDAETGLAPRCGSRITRHMNYYGTDLQRKSLKCCTPDLDCSQCRIMSGGWSTKLQPAASDLADTTAFSAWLDTMEVLERIFIYEPETLAVPMPAAMAQ